MSAALETTGVRKDRGPSHNAYTALLGLTLLILAATTALVCTYGQVLFGEIFTAPAVP